MEFQPLIVQKSYDPLPGIPKKKGQIFITPTLPFLNYGIELINTKNFN